MHKDLHQQSFPGCLRLEVVQDGRLEAVEVERLEQEVEGVRLQEVEGVRLQEAEEKMSEGVVAVEERQEEVEVAEGRPEGVEEGTLDGVVGVVEVRLEGEEEESLAKEEMREAYLWVMAANLV